MTLVMYVKEEVVILHQPKFLMQKDIFMIMVNKKHITNLMHKTSVVVTYIFCSM